MKKILQVLSLFAFSGLILSSCTENNDDDYYLTANFKSVFSSDMNVETSVVQETDTTSLNKFSSSSLIYPQSDINFWYYRYVISAVDISNIVVKVTSTNSNFTLNDGSLSFFTMTNDTTVITKQTIFTDWTLGETSMNLGKTLVFNNSNNQYDDIFELLTDFKPFGVTFSGTTAETNVKFSVEIAISAYVWIYY